MPLNIVKKGEEKSQEVYAVVVLNEGNIEAVHIASSKEYGRQWLAQWCRQEAVDAGVTEAIDPDLPDDEVVKAYLKVFSDSEVTIQEFKGVDAPSELYMEPKWALPLIASQIKKSFGLVLPPPELVSQTTVWTATITEVFDEGIDTPFSGVFGTEKKAREAAAEFILQHASEHGYMMEMGATVLGYNPADPAQVIYAWTAYHGGNAALTIEAVKIDEHWKPYADFDVTDPVPQKSYLLPTEKVVVKTAPLSEADLATVLKMPEDQWDDGSINKEDALSWVDGVTETEEDLAAALLYGDEDEDDDEDYENGGGGDYHPDVEDEEEVEVLLDGGPPDADPYAKFVED